MASPDGSPPVATVERLDSWKEIAAYLNRGLSTVQRWEQHELLPVHRLVHGKGGSVFAYKRELDEWWASRGAALEGTDSPAAKGEDAGAAPELRAGEPGRRPATATGSGSRRLFVALAAVLGVGVVAAGARWFAAPSAGPDTSQRLAHPAPQRFVLPLPPEYPFAPISRMPLANLKPALAISPDGGRLVYAALHDDRVRLVAYDMNAQTVTSIAGSEDAHTPFFSPDGARLGFIARGKLWTTDMPGEAATSIADVSSGWGAAWGTDGAIYFNAIEWSGLTQVDPATGRTVSILSTGTMPEPLAPGLGVLATVSGNQIALIRDGRIVRPLVQGFAGRLLWPDYLLYARPGTLMGASFDAHRAEVTGSGAILAGDLRTGPYSVAEFTVTSAGALVYVPGQDSLLAHFVRVGSAGRRTRCRLPDARYGEFSVTPDGTRLAATVYPDTPDRYSDLVVYDLARAGTEGAVANTMTRPDGMPEASPVFPKWDTDGQHLFYGLREGSRAWLAWSRPDGSDFRIVWRSGSEGPSWLYPMSFSPDGRVLAAFGPAPGSRMDLYTLRIRDADGTVKSDVTPVPYISTPALESFPQFSPDGTAIAYASDATGRYEVYVSAFPNAGTPCRVSHDAAFDPTWVSGGRAIVYQANTDVFERTVESLADCRFGPPQLLFSGFADRPGFGHDVLSGGEWLMLESDDYDTPTTVLHVITNVREALRRRAPATPEGR